MIQNDNMGGGGGASSAEVWFANTHFRKQGNAMGIGFHKIAQFRKESENKIKTKRKLHIILFHRKSLWQHIGLYMVCGNLKKHTGE